jgi:FAD dependent oxidoreductase
MMEFIFFTESVMNSVAYGTANQQIPVTIEADVIVLGAGPGGLGAAVTAARSGADTVIVERYAYPGGMASVGEVEPFMANHANAQPLDRPVYVEWAARMKDYTPGEVHEDDMGSGWSRIIDKNAAALAAEDLLLEAGVRPVYHHHLFDCVMDGDRIEAVILFSKSGLTAAKAKVFIDCTGDADLAFKAGCETEEGNEEGFCQPMTLCFKLENADLGKRDANRDVIEVRKALNKAYLEAKEKGEIDCPRENVLAFFTLDNDVLHFNTTRVIKHSATDGLSLSEAEIEGRRQMRQLLRLFQERVPGFENARIRSMAAHIGVRESRRVMGQNFIGLEHFEKCAKFDDAIARVSYPIDIHSPTGSGTDIRRVPPNDWYEIPYGCIVPKGVNNLLVGGRPISVDHAVHSSMRVMPPAVSVGQAAGMAAAMAVEQGVKPEELDGCAVRKRLVEFGARL